MVLTFPPELVGSRNRLHRAEDRGTYYEDWAEIMIYRNTLRRVQVQARTPEEIRALLVRRIEELT